LLITPFFPTHKSSTKGKDRYNLAKSLSQYFREITVITIGSQNNAVEMSSYDDFTVFKVPSKAIIPNLDYPLVHIAKLLRLVRSIGNKYDVHHYYNQEYLTALPVLQKFRRKVKVLTIDNFPGVDYNHGNLPINLISALYSNTVSRFELRKFDGIISLSTLSLYTAIRLGVKSKNLRLIPHGVDTQRTKPDSAVRRKVRDELNLDGLVVTFVGRLSPVKGIVYLADAIKRLDKEELKAHFIIVGEGSERRRLQDLKNNSNSKVHILGYQRNSIRFIQAADFLVLPSLGEGCPNVVLEAFACGKPVVASRVGGVPDLVKSGENGLLINPKDKKALIEAIRYMATDSNRRRIMGKNAREFAERELSWNVIAEKILCFYNKLLIDSDI